MSGERRLRPASRAALRWALLHAGLWLASATMAGSPRTTVVVDWRCSSEISERSITIFANGTVRLRERLGERARLRLAETDAERVRSLVRLLAGEDLREARQAPGIVRGEWVSRCGLDLVLEPGLPDRFTYSELDPLPLSLARVLQHLEGFVGGLELRDLTELPLDYEPELGDVLRSFEGLVFEVIAFTADYRGIEIQERDGPMTEYISVESVRDRFVELVSRRGRH